MLDTYYPTKEEARKHLESIRGYYEETVMHQIERGDLNDVECTLRNYQALFETRGVKMMPEEMGVTLVDTITHIRRILEDLNGPTNGSLKTNAEALRDDLAKLCSFA